MVAALALNIFTFEIQRCQHGGWIITMLLNLIEQIIALSSASIIEYKH